jgi:diaminopimelate epimerase
VTGVAGARPYAGAVTSLRFALGHGTENDFVVLPPTASGEPVELTPSLVRALCDRRSGLGADGVLRVVRCADEPEAAAYAGAAEWFMDYRNADGSLAEMCGNGARVYARYLARAGLVDVGVDPGGLVLATRGGLKAVRLPADGDSTGDITVDIGTPRLAGEQVCTLAGSVHAGTAVDIGNPHLVCLVADAGALVTADLGAVPQVDRAAFPDGVNVELVAVLPDPVEGTDLHVAMRVHERGVGETRSCGTGACAVAAVALRSVGRSTGTVAVDVPGGRVVATITADTATLAGPAVIVAEGELTEQWLATVPANVPAAVPASPGTPAGAPV